MQFRERVYIMKGSFGISSNGRTADSDSVSLGSSPGIPASTQNNLLKYTGYFFYHPPKGAFCNSNYVRARVQNAQPIIRQATHLLRENRHSA